MQLLAQQDVQALFPDPEQIKTWVNERVAKLQRVSAVEIRDEEFPRNALGKLLKRQLREPYWQDQ